MSVVLRFRCCCWSTSVGTGTVTLKKNISHEESLDDSSEAWNTQGDLISYNTVKGVLFTFDLISRAMSFGNSRTWVKRWQYHQFSAKPIYTLPSASLTIQEGEKHRFPDILSCCYSYSHFPLSKMIGMNYLLQQRNSNSLRCVLWGQSTGMF